MTAVRQMPREVARQVVSRFQASRADTAFARLTEGSGLVIAGPWHSEVGFEVLYWIPMLRWIAASFGLDPQRVVAISRGGAEPWYEGVAGKYVDLLDDHSLQELTELRELRLKRLGCQKQLSQLEEDTEIVDTVATRLGSRDAKILHPAAMFGLFRWFWSGVQSAELVSRHTVNAPLGTGTASPELAAALPEHYVAVKPYFSSCFPDDAENRAYMNQLLAGLRKSHEVVLLDTDLGIDEHRHYVDADGTSLRAGSLLEPRNNLAVQTQIIAGADALFSTYGGFSYLGPFLGVPTVSFFSEENFNPEHLEAMQLATDELAGGGAGAPFSIDHRDRVSATAPDSVLAKVAA